ncbi:TPA: hypothetical protein MYP94_005531, partial [Citrobacter braakii]|nr:hypothetical protein [Citrobacter braakii]
CSIILSDECNSFKGQLWNVIYWFDAGLINNRPNICGFNNSSLINAGVTWTLHWEWLLYFSLPIISLFKNNKNGLPVIIFIGFFDVLVIPHYDYNSAVNILLFCAGFLAREISFKIKNNSMISFFTVFLFYSLFATHNIDMTLLMVPFACLFFVLIIQKGSFWGVLNNRGIVRLGEVSYSFYLLHGIGWFILNRLISSPSIHIVYYLFFALLDLVVISIISSFCYRFLEAPLIVFGKKLSKRMV